MTGETQADEKDLALLADVILNFFTAEPSTIPPFSSSKLSWSVTAPNGVIIRLDGIGVAKNGENWVSPSSTQAYRLSAKAGRLSKDLGVVSVHVNLGQCITHDTGLIAQILAAVLRDQINASTTGTYFRLVPIQTPQGTTTYVPSTPKVWVTPDRLNIFLQLAQDINDFPDPAVDVSISFGLQVIQDSIGVYGTTRLAPIGQDIRVDITVAWYVWLIPGALIGLPIAIDGAKAKVAAVAAEVITEIVGKPGPPHSNQKSLDNFFATPLNMQKHNVQLYVDQDGHGVFSVTYCPRSGPTILS